VARGSRRAVKRGPKDQLWTILVIDGLTVDDITVKQEIIVEAADWAVGGGFEHATVLRTRGWLTFQPPTSTPSTMFCTISVQDSDIGAGSSNPTDPTVYLDEDIIWTYGTSVAATVANDLLIPPVIVDVKAMRRITSGQELRLTMVSGGPALAAWSVNGVLRSLVRRGGN